MIQQNNVPWHTRDWQNALKEIITSPDELIELLNLPESSRAGVRAASKSFPLRLPKTLLGRIQRGNPEDPILKQFLPTEAELQHHDGYTATPLEEKNYNPHSGLLQKYSGRVLFIATQHCVVNCRYCFRRHFNYHENTPGKLGLQPALTHIRQDLSIEEVILSGGDPLNLTDAHLNWLLNALAEIPHVRTIRFHTRTAVIVPQRITSDFLSILNTKRFQFVFVLHTNHAQEIDDHVHLSLNALRTKALLLNQSVLLKGVNDTVEVQYHLSRRLIACGVIPYYLHLLDKVAGAAHFDTLENKAIDLMKELQQLLPGYAVPKLVREVPGQGSKMIVEAAPL